jgi:hypothetical protein
MVTTRDIWVLLEKCEIRLTDHADTRAPVGASEPAPLIELKERMMIPR